MKTRIVFFLVLWIGLFFYTGHKLSQFAPHRRTLAWGTAFVFFLLMTAWQWIYRLESLSIESTSFYVLAWAGSCTLGLWASWMLYSLPFDLFYFIFGSAQKRWTLPFEFDASKRQWMSSMLPTGLMGIAAGSTGFGLIEALSEPKVVEVVVPIPNLHPDLEGLKIAQISDLHVGPTIRRNYVEQVVTRIQALKPDLIAITGDLIDGHPTQLHPHVEPLSGLRAPLGTFYVTGNHEYYWNALDWLEKARNLGFHPLINESKTLKIKNSRLLVAGVTDTQAHQFIPEHQSSPTRAIQSPESSDLKLLLAHRPESCFDAENCGFDLQLSGHTHAGQFFPWNFLVRLAHKYYRGLNRHGKMWVYVNAGTGYWGPAQRFLVPSEITLIRLKSEHSGGIG